ncbi:MAG: preprotein translocase subunit SecE [Desulfovibrio sp.]|uniref:preprotein translocase subunit SecE n=1 Tax=Desulfovibrio sp. 7SRBS1 TaxID=3378064 RepID=UPI003B403A17
MAKDKQQRKKSSKVERRSKQQASEEKVSVVDRLRSLREFFEQSKVEIKKVTWPSRKETIATSIAVVVMTIVMAIYLGLVDVALAKIIEAILS